MPLRETLDRLAAFVPVNLPVISLYLSTQADRRGRASYHSFLRKELKAKLRTYPLRSPAGVSFDTDVGRIKAYVENIRPSTNSVAIFACAGAGDFFETVALDAPIDEHRLYVYHQPHLYPLARLSDQFQRYAALIADTNAARIYVFGIGENLGEVNIRNPNVSKTQLGGWSQARYQRHIRNYHLHHAKEVVEVLDRVVQKEKVRHIVLAGDEVILPVLLRQFPPHLSELVIDTLRLDIKTPEHIVAERTLESLQAHEAKTDVERVEQLMDQYRADGLAVVGVHDTLAALSHGQVDVLYLSGSLEAIHADDEEVGRGLFDKSQKKAVLRGGGSTLKIKVTDELVTRALQTEASITFIENPALLADFGGIGATLRYQLNGHKPISVGPPRAQ